jgi:hypothetical protein
MSGSGTAKDPWLLRTAPGSSEYTMHRDEDADPPALVCQVGSTTLRYHLRAIDDLHGMLVDVGGWVPLGAADEKKHAAEGSIEAWGRAPDNPVRGWYGLRKGYRGRFGMYLPPLLEELGLIELEHNPRSNRARPARSALASTLIGSPLSKAVRTSRAPGHCATRLAVILGHPPDHDALPDDLIHRDPA